MAKRRAGYETDQRRACGGTGTRGGGSAAADDQAAFAIQELLATRWATALADRTVREPGEPGVRLRCYLGLRQEASPA
ncbi:DUF6207 family protein [Streptomyces albogriseolus]|uniref:DUF6207 family protein n=1 Tax=Streptomyces albogriseolus TaxID=1887 RepID=UPI0036F17B67